MTLVSSFRQRRMLHHCSCLDASEAKVNPMAIPPILESEAPWIPKLPQPTSSCGVAPAESDCQRNRCFADILEEADSPFHSAWRDLQRCHRYCRGRTGTGVDGTGDVSMPPMVVLGRDSAVGFTSFWWMHQVDANSCIAIGTSETSLATIGVIGG